MHNDSGGSDSDIIKKSCSDFHPPARAEGLFLVGSQKTGGSFNENGLCDLTRLRVEEVLQLLLGGGETASIYAMKVCYPRGCECLCAIFSPKHFVLVAFVQTRYRSQ